MVFMLLLFQMNCFILILPHLNVREVGIKLDNNNNNNNKIHIQIRHNCTYSNMWYVCEKERIWGEKEDKSIWNRVFLIQIFLCPFLLVIINLDTHKRKKSHLLSVFPSFLLLLVLLDRYYTSWIRVQWIEQHLLMILQPLGTFLVKLQVWSLYSFLSLYVYSGIFSCLTKTWHCLVMMHVCNWKNIYLNVFRKMTPTSNIRRLIWLKFVPSLPFPLFSSFSFLSPSYMSLFFLVWM